MKKLFFFCFILFLIGSVYAKYPDKKAHLIVCDVGQGDAILISQGFFQLLIDTGPDEKLLDCLNDNIPFWDKKIDVLILTHFDADHVGGFVELTNFYEIGNIFLPLTEYKESDLYLELKERLLALKETGTVIKEPFLGQQIAFYNSTRVNKAKYNSIEPLFFTFLTPFTLNSEKYAQLEENNAFSWEKAETILSDKKMSEMADQISENDGSIVLLMQYGILSILLVGDLETTGEESLLELSLINKVDILKVGHHGAKTSSSLSFLLKTRPETSLVSVGENNKFDHPSPEVLSALESISSRVFRTDQQKELHLILEEDFFYLKDKKITLPF